MSRDTKELLRQNLSPFIQGTEIDAVLAGLDIEATRQSEFAVAAFDQLFLSTASGEYLARKAAEIGITQPDVLGIEDFLFRELAISLTAYKQITSVIHDVLEIFYGPDVTRAFARGQNSGPYDLLNPSDPNLTQYLEFTVDGTRIYYEVREADYPVGTLTSASAEAVASAITRAIRLQGSLGYADVDTDPNTNQKFIRIFSGAKGPRSSVQVLGGDLVRILGLPQTTPLVTLAFPNPPTTTWQVAKVGNNVRFTFLSGDTPSLILISDDFRGHLFGAQFAQYELYGSFAVTTVQQGGPGLGYFELDAPGAIIPGGSVVINQANVNDILFARAPIQRPNYRRRYALAWNSVAQQLKIYLPAVTRVIRRELIGSAHMHLLKSTASLNNTTWGSVSDDRDRLTILTERSFAFTPRDYEADILAFGGSLSVAYSSAKNYQAGTRVTAGGLYYEALQQSGPAFGGSQPVSNPSYWEQVDSGGLIEYIRRDDGRVVVVMQPDSPHGLATSSGDLSNDLVTITDVTITQDDPLHPFPGAYVYDPNARYVLASTETDLEQDVLAGSSYSLLDVNSSTGFPTTKAYAAFAFGTQKEEYPVPLIGTLSGKLRVDPSYKFRFSHQGKPADWDQSTTYGPGDEVYFDGRVYRSRVISNLNNLPEEGPFWDDRGISTKITLLSSSSPIELDPFGSDYGFYVTGTADARDYARELLEKQVTALGIQLNIVIVYPSGKGIGNGLEPTDAQTYDFDAITVPQGGSTYKMNDLIYSYAATTEDQE